MEACAITKYVVTAAWGVDTPHLSPEAQAELAASYSPHELAARTRGIPQLGSGAIYPIQESEIVCEPFQLPAYYRHAYALDVGWQRTAALWGAQDAESGVIYLYSEHYQGEQIPIVHAEAIKSRGEWIPGVIDFAARGRSPADGDNLFRQYQAAGLHIVAAEKLWKGSRPPVEAGIYDVWTGFSTGKIKVFSNLANFLGEFRLYRRDEKGHIVKTNDHLMDSLRYPRDLRSADHDPATARPVGSDVPEPPGAEPQPHFRV